MDPSLDSVSCDDFMQFKKVLDVLRKKDDRISNELNSKLPTKSFSSKVDATATCKTFYEELMKGHRSREAAIKNCIHSKSESVSRLRESGGEAATSHKQIRREQTSLRQLQTELFEEQIIQRSALKIFYERCRDFYRPPELVDLFT